MNFKELDQHPVASGPVVPPPAHLRMASKPSAGQVEATAKRSQEHRDSRREESRQSLRRARRKAGALATAAAASLAIIVIGPSESARTAGEAVRNAFDAAAARVAPSMTGHTYSQEELSQYRQQPVTVEPAQGVDEVILEVPTNGRSNIFSDGPDLAAVRKYIEGQHPGQLQAGEQVDVPVLPADHK